jgi:Caspase domain
MLGGVLAMRFAVLMILLFAVVVPAEAAKRVALVIGNSAYLHANPLTNPKNDAEDVAKKFAELGFDVTSGQNLDLNSMRNTVRGFIKKLEGADLAVFYYAGHGLQIKGTNYMVPVDAKLATEDDVGFEAVGMDAVLAPMERVSRTNLVFLDACRDNPLAKNLARSMGTRSAAVGQGLAQQGGGVGTLIAFATQPGNVALDGKGRNSPFTTALLKHLGTPGQDIMRDMVMVRRDVIATTSGAQVPWDNSSLTGDVILKAGDGAVAIALPDDTTTETTYWNSILTEKDASFFEQYLARFPKGKFADLARMKIDLAKPAPVPRATAVAPKPEKKLASLQEGFTEPTAAFPFDGYWSVTRIAAKLNGKSTCGWPSIESGVEISQGKIDHPEWQGTVDASGNFQMTHFFIDDETGKKGRNRLSGKLTVDLGTGKFKQIAGGCNGALKLARDN